MKLRRPPLALWPPRKPGSPPQVPFNSNCCRSLAPKSTALAVGAPESIVVCVLFWGPADLIILGPHQMPLIFQNSYICGGPVSSESPVSALCNPLNATETPHAHTSIRVHMSVYMCVCTHTCICICICTCKRTCTSICRCKCRGLDVYVYASVYVYDSVFSMYTYTYTYMHVKPCSKLLEQDRPQLHLHSWPWRARPSP